MDKEDNLVPPLNFNTYAKDAFGFLEKEYGYAITEERKCFLKYESGYMEFRVIFDCRRSYELSFTIERVGLDPISYSQGHIIKCSNDAEVSHLSFIQVSKEEVLKEFIHKLADFARDYCHALLVGDAETFSKLGECMEKEMKKYALEGVMSHARRKSEKAWRAKDYKAYVEIMEPHIAHLKQSEMQKLYMARKRS